MVTCSARQSQFYRLINTPRLHATSGFFWNPEWREQVTTAARNRNSRGNIRFKWRRNESKTVSTINCAVCMAIMCGPELRSACPCYMRRLVLLQILCVDTLSGVQLKPEIVRKLSI